MPYSGIEHTRPVAAALALISHIRSNLDNFLMPFYSDLAVPRIDLHGKLAIITGANSGIGFEAARELVGLGAHVILACRSQSRGEEAVQKIIELTGSNTVELELLDCSSFKSVKAFLERWEKREKKQIDILINNAGGLSSTVAVTEDGFEQTYQSNHLSHVLLTHTFLNRGRFVRDARIVSVSSLGYYTSDSLDEHNTGCSDIIAKYDNKIGTLMSFPDTFQLYARSKANQLVWTMTLQRQLSQTEGWKNVSVHSCNPGVVNTPIWTRPTRAGSIPGSIVSAFQVYVKTLGIPPQQGAVVPVWLAVAPEPVKPELKGMYWDRLRWKWVAPWSMEVERQDKLWNKWCEDTGASLI
ncbi:NAD(P)-binding protein [Ceratobasidium sp. AG-I]|nr:NAD(P)-binding protein [Ceratobasidium sp. AG-I]